MTKALHRKRKAEKAVEAAKQDHHRLVVARGVLEATHDPGRVRLLCEALEWEAEEVLQRLEGVAIMDTCP